jgi:hypothetical protein
VRGPRNPIKANSGRPNPTVPSKLEQKLPATPGNALALTLDPSIVEAFIQQPNHLVDRTWGSSSDWVLELRDGKRLSIPLSLLQPPDPIGSSDANLHVQICTGEENWT